MKIKRLFEWCVVISALTIIPGLIIFWPRYYALGTLILILFWLGAFLVFFGSKCKDT
jgi:hypothetical protein